MSDKDGHTPKVFISSTNIDLEAYRKEAVMAANAAGCLTDLQENWTAEDHLPLDACLERVRKADALGDWHAVKMMAVAPFLVVWPPALRRMMRKYFYDFDRSRPSKGFK